MDLTAIAGMIEHSAPTEFLGYQSTLSAPCKVLECSAVPLGEGESGWVVVLDRTPFYAESGGQVGDTGMLSGRGARFAVLDTKKHGGVWLHLGRFLDGESFAPGDTVIAEVEVERRQLIERNHTGTHLLHWALREVLGPQATQQGSLVEPGRLRFDFAWSHKLEPAQLERIEVLVNARIADNDAVKTEETSLDEARSRGAMALFGEKYGEQVRLVSVGSYSLELCGGTHVRRAGDVGALRVASEGPVSAGVRRMVAITGEAAVRHAQADRRLLLEACAALKLGEPADLPERVAALQLQLKAAEAKLAQLEGTRARDVAREAIGQAETIGGVRVVLSALAGGDAAGLRKMGDEVKKADDAAVGVFVATSGEALAYLVAASPAAIARGLKAGELVRALAAAVGGSGGGRPDMAQGGGGRADQAAAALEAARQAVAAALGA